MVNAADLKSADAKASCGFEPHSRHYETKGLTGETRTWQAQEAPPHPARGPGKEAITFHGLRHTAASLMVMSGVNLRTVQRSSGTSPSPTEKYPHLADDFVATEIAKFSLKPTRPRAV